MENRTVYHSDSVMLKMDFVLEYIYIYVYMCFSQEEYVSEGLEWSFVKYQDNQSCLDLIEGSPVSVFSLLNEVCWSFSCLIHTLVHYKICLFTLSGYSTFHLPVL